MLRCVAFSCLNFFKEHPFLFFLDQSWKVFVGVMLDDLHVFGLNAAVFHVVGGSC